jgi:hypothetical protein
MLSYIFLSFSNPSPIRENYIILEGSWLHKNSHAHISSQKRLNQKDKTKTFNPEYDFKSTRIGHKNWIAELKNSDAVAPFILI